MYRTTASPSAFPPSSNRVLSDFAACGGVVIIGRNEGDRLRRCISSVRTSCSRIVYVDSGSSDGSADWARTQGVSVVDLDLSQPFTAARARNAGCAQLLQQWPQVELVQFVDGDCEVVPGWLEAAASFLASHPDHAVTCGRRRERFPERSIFNAQCDREWNTPPGPAEACGGDAMFRRDALAASGGFRSELIAGEEPELCVRLRAAGWFIWRLDCEMTLHDAALLHWRQWWKRTKRAGHAFAEGSFLHGATPERHWVRETRSALVWGLVLPGLVLVAAVLVSPWLLAALLVYPLQVLRLALRNPANGGIQGALLLVLGKFAEASGVVDFWLRRLLRRPHGLIEYK